MTAKLHLTFRKENAKYVCNNFTLSLAISFEEQDNAEQDKTSKSRKNILNGFFGPPLLGKIRTGQFVCLLYLTAIG